jgi:hypothetical protein
MSFYLLRCLHGITCSKNFLGAQARDIFHSSTFRFCKKKGTVKGGITYIHIYEDGLESRSSRNRLNGQIKYDAINHFPPLFRISHLRQLCLVSLKERWRLKSIWQRLFPLFLNYFSNPNACTKSIQPDDVFARIYDSLERFRSLF